MKAAAQFEKGDRVVDRYGAYGVVSRVVRFRDLIWYEVDFDEATGVARTGDELKFVQIGGSAKAKAPEAIALHSRTA